MPAKHVFEYAVVRVVPRVEREEFVNVGVILYCRGAGFLRVRYQLPEARLRALLRHPDELDFADLTTRLQAIERICQGRQTGGPIGQLGVAERFRWLTSARSTVVQMSAVHPGMCHDAAAALDHLYDQLVG